MLSRHPESQPLSERLRQRHIRHSLRTTDRAVQFSEGKRRGQVDQRARHIGTQSAHALAPCLLSWHTWPGASRKRTADVAANPRTISRTISNQVKAPNRDALLRSIEDLEATFAEFRSNNTVLVTSVFLGRLEALEMDANALADPVLIARMEKLRRQVTTGNGLD